MLPLMRNKVVRRVLSFCPSREEVFPIAHSMESEDLNSGAFCLVWRLTTFVYSLYEGFPHPNLGDHEGFPHPQADLFSKIMNLGGGGRGEGV